MSNHYEYRVFWLIVWILGFVIVTILSFYVFLPIALDLMEVAGRYPPDSWQRIRFFVEAAIVGVGPFLLFSFLTLMKIIGFIRHERDRERMRRMD